MIFTGSASPLNGAPGAALLYIAAGLICWPRTTSPRGRAGRAKAKPYGLLGEHGTRLAWASLWLSSAVLWILPANTSSNATHDAIAAVPSGTSWLTGLLDAVAKATTGHGTTIAIVMAVLPAAIGAAVLRERLATPALVIGIAISVAYWVIGQGLGGVFTGQATDIGTAPLVILVAGLLYAHTRHKPALAAGRQAAAHTA